jgi:hypothetical protein
MINRFSMTLLLVLSFASSAQAQETTEQNVDAKRDWSVFRATSEPKECWIVTIPESWEVTQNGKKTTANRGEITLIVTTRPGSNTVGEISYKAGYPIKEGSNVEVRIGDSTFQFYVDGEWAWPANPDADQKVLAALQRGASAVVTATSQKGKTTVDNFSLLGFSAAWESAVSMCKQ